MEVDGEAAVVLAVGADRLVVVVQAAVGNELNL